MRLISDDILAVITIWMEASGEQMDGKVAVAEVIRNRIEQKVHSDGTLAGTVLRPWQFSGWNQDSPRRIVSALLDSNDKEVQACMTAWHTAMLGDTQIAKGATYYFNPAGGVPTWAKSLKKLVSIGAHDFYGP
jgi:spore germination cell wall hydrolase CwlJ-like protein